MPDQEYRMRKMAGLVAGKESVLDLGWADHPNGYFRNRLVVGLDLSEGETPGNYSRCMRGDVMDLPEPFGAEEFDAVVAGELLEHLEDPAEFLRRCLKVLRPGGTMVLSTPNPNSPIERSLTLFLVRRYFYTENHLMLYPQRWLIRMMERAGFTDVRLISGGFPLPLLGLVPFPRPWCYQTIAEGRKPAK